MRKLSIKKKYIFIFISLLLASAGATLLYYFWPFSLKTTQDKPKKPIDDKVNNDEPKIESKDNKSPETDNKPKVIKKETIDKNALQAENIFPDISISDYYDLIRIEKGMPVITDDMIAYIIQDVIKKLSVNYGDVEAGYFQPTRQQLHLDFVWKYKNQEVNRKYLFTVGYEV
ncbi:MHO_1590 family protein [Mycoplasma sp. 1573]